MGGAIVPLAPVVCVGPVKYSGETLAAVRHRQCEGRRCGRRRADNHVFLPATAPSGVGMNEYYKSRGGIFPCRRGRAEQGIHGHRRRRHSGADRRSVPARYFLRAGPHDSQKKRRAEIYVEATTPRSRASGRTCAVPYLLRHQRRPAPLRSGPHRHHRLCAEDRCWLLQLRGGQSAPRARISSVRAGQGAGRQSLVPGVITHASNIVEHPELIAERIVRFARLVGRENVIAGADCGSPRRPLQDRGPSDRGLGKIQGDAPGRRPRHKAALGVNAAYF